MALKLTVHERCQKCGPINAVLEGDRIRGSHKCPAAPPGPPSPPINYHKDQVVFVRAEFTADELRGQLDAERAAHADTREKMVKYRFAVRRAIKDLEASDARD